MPILYILYNPTQVLMEMKYMFRSKIVILLGIIAAIQVACSPTDISAKAKGGGPEARDNASKPIKNRPNIIVILADDLGYNDVGFTGKTDIKTPVLDMLAKGGVIFENGYVTHPYCGPSRAGLLTGRYQARFGMENNVSYSPDDKFMGLPLGETTVADRLKSAGYQTAIFGKWHLGAAPHFQPNNRGFDYFYGFLDGGHNYFPDGVNINAGGYSAPIIRNKKPVELTEYLTTDLSKDAAKFIRQQEDEPYFIYMSYNAPHTPLEAPQGFLDKYSHIEDLDRRTYAAMVDAMDEGIGLLVEALRETNQFDNTLIFFLSDNGGTYPEEWMSDNDWADNSPYRRGKVSLLEGGIHVPFIAHWPNVIPKGEKFQGLVSALDIAATSTAIASADTSDGQLDGVNLIPFLTKQKNESPHEALFWRLEEADNIWAVRTSSAKYMNQPLPGVGPSIFDMSTDPNEQENLFGSRPNVQSELARLWNEWNEDNINNILQQSWEYSISQDKFYDQQNERDVEQAKNRGTYSIE